MLSVELPNDFELRFDWKVAEGSNSGVYYRQLGSKCQILDNQKHRDGTTLVLAASLYFCVQPPRDATGHLDQWNEGRIMSEAQQSNTGSNGEKVVHLDYRDPKMGIPRESS